MNKLFAKLSIRLILLQVLFLYLFSHAASHLYHALNYEICECLYRNGLNYGELCFQQYPHYRMGDLLAGPIHFMLYGLLAGALIPGIVNWRRKSHFANLLIVFVLYVLLFFSGVFKFTKDLDELLLSFGSVFSGKFWAMNIIRIHCYLVVAFSVLWLSGKRKYDAVKNEQIS